MACGCRAFGGPVQVMERAMRRVGSTRSASLLRILLALLVWAQWAGPMRGIHLMGQPDRLAVSAVFWTITPFMLVGWWSRTSAGLVGLALLLNTVVSKEYIRFEGVDQDPWFLVVAVCLLALTPCGGALSVDRWLSVRRGESLQPQTSQGELWAWPLLNAHLVLLLMSIALSMSRPAFRSGSRLHQHLLDTYFGSVSPLWLEPVCAVVAPALLVSHVALAVGFTLPSLRRRAVWVSLGFHGALFVVLPAGVYTLFVMAMSLAVLDPDEVHRVLDRLQGRMGPS
jgi:hypothetical protein